MLISKDNRKKIHQHLFQEGVLVAKKDFNLPKHPEIDVPNLQVIKAMQSLVSRGFVALRFSWQHYYYTLTNEGIEYLRGVLHLPQEIVPRTFIKSAATKTSSKQPERTPRSTENRDDSYRRADKKESAPAGEFKPEFVCLLF